MIRSFAVDDKCYIPCSHALALFQQIRLSNIAHRVPEAVDANAECGWLGSIWLAEA